MRKLLRVSYLEHKTNDWVWSKIKFLLGPLLAGLLRLKSVAVNPLCWPVVQVC